MICVKSIIIPTITNVDMSEMKALNTELLVLKMLKAEKTNVVVRIGMKI